MSLYYGHTLWSLGGVVYLWALEASLGQHPVMSNFFKDVDPVALSGLKVTAAWRSAGSLSHRNIIQFHFAWGFQMRGPKLHLVKGPTDFFSRSSRIQTVCKSLMNRLNGLRGNFRGKRRWPLPPPSLTREEIAPRAGRCLPRSATYAQRGTPRTLQAAGTCTNTADPQKLSCTSPPGCKHMWRDSPKTHA